MPTLAVACGAQRPTQTLVAAAQHQRQAPCSSKGCGGMKCGTISSTRQPLAAACSSNSRGPGRPRLAAPPPRAAAAEDDVVGEGVEDMAIQQRAAARANQEQGERRVLKLADQLGLSPWQPNTADAAAQQAGSSSSSGGGGSDADDAAYAELLAQLPGLQRQMQAAAQERTGLPPPDNPDLDAYERGYMRMERPAEPEFTAWDLRAKMEKRRRQQQQMDEWKLRKSQVGQYPSMGADWRTDIRCQDTGNPTDPTYREWTHKEIWDLITLNGRNADPRDVQLFVRDPLEIADIPAQGGRYNMEPEEYFESLGRLIREDELEGIVDKDSEVALLASEFSDFDEELLPGGATADFDADYASGEGGDDDF